jgi:hypothetical protein
MREIWPLFRAVRQKICGGGGVLVRLPERSVVSQKIMLSFIVEYLPSLNLKINNGTDAIK